MEYPHQVSGALDDETFGDLKRLAEHFGCTVEHLVTTAVMRFVGEESRVFPNEFSHLPPYVDPDPKAQAWHEAERKAAKAFIDYIEPDGDADGEPLDHEDFMAELKRLDDEAIAQKQKNAA